MYERNRSWVELQQLLPLKNRIDEVTAPRERFIDMNGMEIHLDEYENNSATTVIVLHGVGGNGRLVSFFAVPLARAGLHVICPDLPGYGFSRYKKSVLYEDWIEVGSRIVEHELARGQKVYLIGLSAGGMLAYNVACRHPEISGLIFTNILDNRVEEVRAYSAKNRLQAKYGIRLLNRMPGVVRNVSIPIKMVTNMNGLVNDEKMLKVLLKDKVGAGSNVSLNFLLSMINSEPVLEPEEFTKVPVLMVHPGNDLWTPAQISEIFFDRIAAKKRKVILENAGHFPVEEPGLTQMENAISEFIENGA